MERVAKKRAKNRSLTLSVLNCERENSIKVENQSNSYTDDYICSIKRQCQQTDGADDLSDLDLKTLDYVGVFLH